MPYPPRTMLCDLPGCGHGFGRRVFAGRHYTRSGQRHPVSTTGRAADVAEDLAGEVALDMRILKRLEMSAVPDALADAFPEHVVNAAGDAEWHLHLIELAPRKEAAQP